jgi:hypothetical protein
MVRHLKNSDLGISRALHLIALLICTTTLCTAAASTKDVYIAQNASGAASGADCQDAFGVTWFNSSANWGAGINQIGPGTTVHLCGVITSSLTAQKSGASSSPITIQFEANAKISVPFCAGDACLSVNGLSWITIDGGSNGIIENTANGTNLANHANSTAIDAANTTNVEVRNLLIQNLYVHVGTTDAAEQFPDGCVIFNGANNFSVHGIIGHDMHWCLTGGGSNVSVYDNEVSHVDHALTFGNQSSGTTISNINIYGNHFHDYANWDVGDLQNHPYHHDGIQLWGLSTGGGTSSNNGQVTNLKIYNNLFDGDTGVWATGAIYLLDSVNNAFIFNNIIIGNPTRTIYGYIRIDATTGDNAQGPISVYNNSVIGNDPNGYCVWGTFQNSFSVKNNAITGCQNLIEIDNSTLAAGGLNNNVYQQSGSSSLFGWSSKFTSSLASWQAESGQDGNSKLVASIGLDASGNPQTGAAITGAAINLTNLGIDVLNSDRAGNARPASGAWDAGALNAGAGAAKPAPPTDLTASVQ